MGQGFYIDSENCYGCKTCQVACAKDKQLHSNVFLRRVRRYDMPSPAGLAYVSMACNHCDDPACLANCPVGAYEKNEDGLVIQDHSKCIGCRSCIISCPFHAPSYDEESATTYKCDGCIDRQKAGLRPVCNVVCPSQNLMLGDYDELPVATEIKSEVATRPNLKIALDKDIDKSVLTHVDTDRNQTDIGCESL